MPPSRKKTTPRRSPLTRGKILKKAQAMADKDGIESLSMRKIAQGLRVEAMSLYNHVKNKDDILDGLVDLVVAEIEVPDLDDEWRATMRRRAHSAHEVLMQHPWAAMLLMSRINVGPAMLNYVNATLGCLQEAGFSIVMADHVWNTLDSYIYGFTLQKINFPFEPDEYSEAAEDFMPQLPMDQYPYLQKLSQQVMQGEHDGIHDLAFGLDLLLDALENLRR